MGPQEPRCQCHPGCREPPLKGSPFCSVHQKCERRAPTTGWEPAYNPERYNRLKGDRESHNCYAYAFDYLQRPKKGCTDDSCPAPYPQPGRASGYKKWSKVDGKRCPDLMARLMGDIKGIQIGVPFETRCPKGMRKIATVVDPTEDYHFYMQNKPAPSDDSLPEEPGMWSHKPGGQPVTNKDASGRPIFDPELAYRVVKDANLNYREFCGFQCIPVVENGKKKTFRLGRGGYARRTARSVRQTQRARRTARSVRRTARSVRRTQRVRSARRKAVSLSHLAP